VKRLTRVLICVAATASSVALFAIPAEAHVTIDTLGTVAKGSFAKLAFSVPNERDDAGTVSVKVQMPQNSPLASVSVLKPPVGNTRPVTGIVVRHTVTRPPPN